MKVNELIQRNWQDLSEDGQIRALARGRARRAECTVMLAETSGWNECLHEDGSDPSRWAAWPCHKIKISIGGVTQAILVGGAHCLTPIGCALRDGEFSGEIRVDASAVHGGDNDHRWYYLPVLDNAGVALIYDETKLQADILAVQDAAAHEYGSPSIEYLEDDDLDTLTGDCRSTGAAMTNIRLVIRKSNDDKPAELELRPVGRRSMAFLLGINVGVADTLEDALRIPRVVEYCKLHNPGLLPTGQSVPEAGEHPDEHAPATSR